MHRGDEAQRLNARHGAIAAAAVNSVFSYTDIDGMYSTMTTALYAEIERVEELLNGHE